MIGMLISYPWTHGRCMGAFCWTLKELCRFTDKQNYNFYISAKEFFETRIPQKFEKIPKFIGLQAFFKGMLPGVHNL